MNRYGNGSIAACSPACSHRWSLALRTAVAQTLKAVKDRGTLHCGVSEGLYGFSAPDDKGDWSGFDVDFCRAIAAAIFNDAEQGQITFRSPPASASARCSRAASMSCRATRPGRCRARPRSGSSSPASPTTTARASWSARSLNKESALELDGIKVCAQTGTTTELNLADYFRTNSMKYRAGHLADRGRRDEGLRSRPLQRPHAPTFPQLHADRLKLAKPDDHVILPDVISKEPLGPAVRQGDDQWFNIVKWAHFAMINAEELGVNSKTIGEALKSEKPDVKRLVGSEGSYGEQIGLTKDWAARIVRHVGNYGEVFERNVGVGSRLGHSTRHQPALERRRHSVCSANPLTGEAIKGKS